MAEGTKLVCTFETDEDKSVTMSFKYAKPNAEPTAVKTFMQAVIANNSIFENRPVVIKSAKTVTTSETVYDLSNLEGPFNSEEAFARGLISEEEYLENCLGRNITPDEKLLTAYRAKNPPKREPVETTTTTTTRLM